MKSTLTLLAFALSLCLNAQIQKGDNVLIPGNLFGFFNIGVERYAGGNIGSLHIAGENEFTGAQLTFGAEFYRMVGNRIGVGGTFGVIGSAFEFEDFGAGLLFAPGVRYYAINRPNILGYGGLGVGGGIISTSDSEIDLSSVTLTAGAQLPLGAGILLDGALSYGIGDRRNTLGLTGGLEIILGRNNRPEEKPMATVGKGTLMLGAQSLGLRYADQSFSGDLNIAADYFIADRISLGIGLNTGYTRIRNSFARQNTLFTNTTFGVGVTGRYYFTTVGRTLWYGELGLVYDRWRNAFEDPLDQIITNTLTPTLRGGAQWFIREQVFLSLGPFLNLTVRDRLTDGNTISNSGSRWAAGVHFGIGVVL